MSHSCMTSIYSSSASSLSSTHNQERLDLDSIRLLVVLVNQHIHEFLADPEIRNSLRLRCISKLKIQKQEFIEFSEQSVLSNLYWSIENIEAAIQTKWPEEKASRLKNSEHMLQVPALLDEHGVTAGIPNRYLVCCSYFYLSLVSRFQRDEWQVALHFLQALLVSPRLVQKDFAPELCQTLLLLCSTYEKKEVGERTNSESVSLVDCREDQVGEALRQMARRYKDWLVFYQVMLYGESPQKQNQCTNLPSPGYELQNKQYSLGKCIVTDTDNSIEHGKNLPTGHHFAKVHPLDPQKITNNGMAEEVAVFPGSSNSEDYRKALKNMDQLCSWDIRTSSEVKCLQDMLKESQSDTSSSIDSCDEDTAGGNSDANVDDAESTKTTTRINGDKQQAESCNRHLYRKQQALCSNLKSEHMGTVISSSAASRHLMHREAIEANNTKFISSGLLSSVSKLSTSIFEQGDKKSHVICNCYVGENTAQRRTWPHDFQCLDSAASTSMWHHRLSHPDHQRSDTREKRISHSQNFLDEVCLQPVNGTHTELVEIFHKAISKLFFSEGLRKCNEDYTVEVATVYEMLNKKPGVKYAILKDMILDQLVTAISSFKEEEAIRASVSILVTIASGNKLVIKDIKRKGLQLTDLASALKRNVQEAAILIYLIKPSPTEIKALELLPTLVEIVRTSNSYKGRSASLVMTPSTACLMIVELLVTACDYATNKVHLAAINSPQVLSELLNMARNNNLEELISLATILVKCVQFDGKCRKYVSQFTPVAPFICLLKSTKKCATFVALELFHEILCVPRSSGISLLQQMRKEGSVNIMHTLLSCIQQSGSVHQLMAANLLIQLDMLEESPSSSTFREEAMEVLLKAVKSEESSTAQLLSAFILSNIGGTYDWKGDPYTVAWLVKKAGSTSVYYRSMIKNFNWLDQSLQDAGIDKWCSKVARSIIKIGNPVFHALEKGLKSKIKRVSRDSLTAIAWLGCEIAKSPNDLRYSACDIILSEIQQFLHPGFDLEERLLACLCVYNYASGKGMQKLIHFSEGVRESLRRLSNTTWMAEELLKVADYFMPNKSRISCVHTQILEAGHTCSGSVSALIYYKGQLYSGYSDGSIKVWDIKGQSAALVWDVKEHTKAVTCFSLFEPGDSLLSGSTDKTIRVWQMAQRKLECTEVIETKEPIQNVDTYDNQIFVISQNHSLKVIDASRSSKDICKRKNVKCMRTAQGKIYVGCMDSSIQEIAITSNQGREIKAPARSWRMRRRPINSIAVYKDWLYGATKKVEGSNLQNWRRHGKPQISIVTVKRTNVLAMEVVEDFIYLNCSSLTSFIQIWLRGAGQQVGRLSAGSRITSLHSANDIILCGTETGLIKGWIPL